MLTVGKIYQISMYETDPKEGPTMLWNCRVVEIRWPVIVFDHAGTELVVNLASSAFIKAESQAAT